MLEASGFLFPNEQLRTLGKYLMSEIIAVILQKVEVIMQTYGFWKPVLVVLFAIFLWQLPNLINAAAHFSEVQHLK